MAGSKWTCAAALTLMLVPALGTVAYADDEYGTGHEGLIRHAALGRMQPMVVLPQPITANQFAAGQSDNFGAPQRDSLISHSATHGSVPLVVGVAETKVTGGGYRVDAGYGRRDLVGDGGRQDELAREIYRPGSGTDF